MRTALLLVDLQRDYLQRTDLCPPAPAVVKSAASLLSFFRQVKWPVFHAHTLVCPDGANRMPHWQRAGIWMCVEGTQGALPPDEVAPLATERVLCKSYFSAFSDAALLPALQQLDIELLIVAGVHTHGCVRASVLDAYQAGLAVWVAADAVASYDPLHAEVTFVHLNGRVCQFLDSRQIRQRLSGSRTTPASTAQLAQPPSPLPVGWVDGVWLAARDHDCQLRRNPIDWSTCLATVPVGGTEDVERAITAAAHSEPSWGVLKWVDRAARLQAWSAILRQRGPEIVSLLASEVGKPQAEANAELEYALALLASTAREDGRTALQRCGELAHVRHCPLGTVGIVSPWNNPLAIPVGKIAPALAWGNCVVWKPAVEAPRLAMLLIDSLTKAGVPPRCVNMVFGDATTVQLILRDPRIAAVSFTGSFRNGRHLAAICAARTARNCRLSWEATMPPL